MIDVQGKIPVTRSSMPLFDEYCDEIRELWDSHWLTNRGVKHKELEDKIQSYLGVEHMSLFVNGHSALECILETMELGKDGRDEVITTPFTFVSTTHAIVRKGLKPVFCDIKEDDFTIDPTKIESLVTDKTCAILPVHVYGNVCDVDAIRVIARKYGLKVIYDAAHAFGVERNGIGIGNFGDATMFSFHATKVFNTIEGGAIAHPDGVLSERLAQWRNFGITSPESTEYVGGNSKMNEFAAAMGLCNLRHIDEEIAKRKAITEHYWEKLEDIKGLRVYKSQQGVKANYAYMPIIIDSELFGATRNDVMIALAEAGIGARKYFYPLTSDCECYEGLFLPSKVSTPIAYKTAENVLTLPLYADLAVNDVDRICEILRRIHG